jgi:hypothetical protein
MPPPLPPLPPGCRQAASATAFAFIFIILVVAVIITVSVTIAAANFSWLLIVVCAPAIAVAADVFVTIPAVRCGSRGGGWRPPPLPPSCCPQAATPKLLPPSCRPQAATAKLPPPSFCLCRQAVAAANMLLLLPTPRGAAAALPPRCRPHLGWEIHSEFRGIPRLFQFWTFWTPEFSSEFYFSDLKMCSCQFWTRFFWFGILSHHQLFQFHELENVPAINVSGKWHQILI